MTIKIIKCGTCDVSYDIWDLGTIGDSNDPICIKCRKNLPEYTVTVTERLTQRATVTVQARNMEEAQQIGEEEIADGDVTWVDITDKDESPLRRTIHTKRNKP